MKIIIAYLSGLLSVWLISKGKAMGYDAGGDMAYALPAAIGTALADDWEWLRDWLQKLKDKSTK